jgi:PAS domain S-box-containing protein
LAGGPVDDADTTALDAVLEGMGDCFLSVDSDWRFTHLNSRAEQYFGLTRESLIGRPIWDLLTCPRVADLRRAMDEAMTRRDTIAFEATGTAQDGLALDFRVFPYRDGVAVAFRDRTAERDARAALAASEAMFRTLVEALPQQVWIMRPDGTATYVNQRFRDYHGEMGPSRDERGNAIHPDDRAEAFALRSEMMAAGKPFTVDVRALHQDGSYRWQRMSVEPLCPDGGAPSAWIGTATDIDDMRRAQDALEASEERLGLVVRELNHRVKNVMAIAQAIANQTLRPPKSAEDARSALIGRFDALGSAIDLLNRSNWSGAAISELIDLNLAGFSSRYVAAGPSIVLRPRAAQTLSLVLYELASNAAKYGALSVPAGRVSVSWSLDAAGFAFAWTEENGPPVVPTRRRGFGRTLLERVAAVDLDATVELDYAAAGFRYRIESLGHAAVVEPPATR